MTRTPSSGHSRPIGPRRLDSCWEAPAPWGGRLRIRGQAPTLTSAGTAGAARTSTLPARWRCAAQSRAYRPRTGAHRERAPPAAVLRPRCRPGPQAFPLCARPRGRDGPVRRPGPSPPGPTSSGPSWRPSPRRPCRHAPRAPASRPCEVCQDFGHYAAR